MTPYRERREAGHYDATSNGESPAAVAEPESEVEAEPEVESDEEADEVWLIDLTKNELIDKAQAMGISPANASMSKGELIEAIEAGG